MTTVKLGDFVTVVKEGQSLLFKVTKFDNEHVWGALVVDRENKKCRKGRPSKIALKDVKSTAVTTAAKQIAKKSAAAAPAKNASHNIVAQKEVIPQTTTSV